MNKNRHRTAFTLVEVMISVVIISVVILALVKIYSNNIFILSSYKKESKISQYSTFLIDNYDYTDKNTTLYNLVDEFNVDDELRRGLKRKKIQISYRIIKNIDLNDAQDSDNIAPISLEIAKSSLKYNGNSVSLLRLQLR